MNIANTTNREAPPNACGSDSETALAVGPEDFSSEIVSSAAFMALGVLVLIGALFMPVAELTGSGDKWYTAPGLFPGLIGTAMAVMSLYAMLRAALRNRACGVAFNRNCLRPKSGDRAASFRLLLAAATLTAYVLLLGKINFTLVTFAYLSGTMLLFRSRGFAFWKIAAVSAAVAIAVTYGFGTLARIPLP